MPGLLTVGHEHGSGASSSGVRLFQALIAASLDMRGWPAVAPQCKHIVWYDISPSKSIVFVTRICLSLQNGHGLSFIIPPPPVVEVQASTTGCGRQTSHHCNSDPSYNNPAYQSQGLIVAHPATDPQR
jgi:hypothetical protein